MDDYDYDVFDRADEAFDRARDEAVCEPCMTCRTAGPVGRCTECRIPVCWSCAHDSSGKHYTGLCRWCRSPAEAEQ
jgi:hypothetical protein